MLCADFSWRLYLYFVQILETALSVNPIAKRLNKNGTPVIIDFSLINFSSSVFMFVLFFFANSPAIFAKSLREGILAILPSLVFFISSGNLLFFAKYFLNPASKTDEPKMV